MIEKVQKEEEKKKMKKVELSGSIRFNKLHPKPTAGRQTNPVDRLSVRRPLHPQNG
jgi:hypothetical protein